LLSTKTGLVKNKHEKILPALLLGAIVPISFFIAGWWGAYLLASESQIPFFMLAGLGMGFVIDLLFLGKWVNMAYQIHPIILIAIYLFYSVGIFGFFMGVPVFNSIMGPLAGFYVGRRLKQEKADPKATNKMIHRTGLFASFVLAVACTASFIMAASEITLAANINGMLRDMLGLNIALDNLTILLLSAFAGIGIVAAEYVLTQAAAKKAVIL
jgi:hypothetical protein